MIINTTPPPTVMCIVKKVYEINSTPSKVFDALTNAETIQLWSADEAKMDASVGTSFSLWSEQITGVNLEIVKNKKLVQEWRYDNWKEASKVTITLRGQDGKTIVSLLHEDVPEKHSKSITDGWDSFYFGAIQDMFNEG